MPHSPTWAHPVPVKHPHSFTLPSLLSPSPHRLYPFSTFLVGLACLPPAPPLPSVTSLYQSQQGYLSISYKVQSLPRMKEIREDAAMCWSSSSHPPLCPFLLSFACTFILFYQKLCSVFTFADVRARACSVCLLFVFISAAGIFRVGNRRKQVWHRAWHLVVWATSMSREKENCRRVLCARQSDTCRCVEEKQVIRCKNIQCVQRSNLSALFHTRTLTQASYPSILAP